MDIEGEVQTHPHAGVVEIVAGDFANPVEPVEDGVSVDAQAFRGFLGAAVGGKEGV